MQNAVNKNENSPRSFPIPAVVEQQISLAEEISLKHNLSSPLARVLAARNFVPGADLDNYLKPSLRFGVKPPSEIKNLINAANFVYKKIKEKNKIAICCDFDVDGLSAGSILQNFFQILNIDSKVYVPDRFIDGYGLTERLVRQLVADNCSLIITVDYGTTNEKEFKLAKELGLAVVVIDHHQVVDKPASADFFINPQQSDCKFEDGILSAAGLTWYFLLALKSCMPEAANIDSREFLDLASLGTICDMVPLKSINRVIACKGVERIQFTRWLGLKALMNAASLRRKPRCSDMSFILGPRINAAGRMASGDLVIELLTSNDSKKVEQIAAKLNRINQQRQHEEEQVKLHALEAYRKLNKATASIVVCDPSYHLGVLGIVAQRLVEAYAKPAAVIGINNTEYKGSVRGVNGFDVHLALNNCAEFLDKFGGHKSAGGFSLKPEKLEEFREAFEIEVERQLNSSPALVNTFADTYLSLDEIQFGLYEELNCLAPFGIGNPAPSFYLKDLIIKDVRVLQSQHLKLNLSDGKRSIDAMFWRINQHPAIYVGATVSVVAKLDCNQYSGRKDLQLVLQAIA